MGEGFRAAGVLVATAFLGVVIIGAPRKTAGSNMVPIVFLILPVTVLFAFYPGVFGLSLTT